MENDNSYKELYDKEFHRSTELMKKLRDIQKKVDYLRCVVTALCALSCILFIILIILTA